MGRQDPIAEAERAGISVDRGRLRCGVPVATPLPSVVLVLAVAITSMRFPRAKELDFGWYRGRLHALFHNENCL